MTRDEIDDMMRDNGIVVVGDAVYALCQLVATSERNKSIDVLMRLHERQGENPTHNYFLFAANILKSTENEK
jgi:hypothetical protein